MTLFARKFFSILIIVMLGVLWGRGKSAWGDVLLTGFTSFDYPGTNITEAYGINNSGQVVGKWAAPVGATYSAGFLYDQGNFSEIRFPGAETTFPMGISNNGLIVGWYKTGDSDALGFLDDLGTYKTIHFPGSTSTVANGVNRNGQVVGFYVDAMGLEHGFLFDGGSYQTITPGAFIFRAIAINDLEQIIVHSSLDGLRWAIYDGVNFSPISLPSPTYQIAGFNNLDQIVGTFSTPSGSKGFVDDHGEILLFDVPEPPEPTPLDIVANGINDYGEVTGWWDEGVGTQFVHAYVGTPVPESGTLSLVATGFVLLAGAICKRRA